MDFKEMTRTPTGAQRANTEPQAQLDTRAIEMAATAAVTATDNLRILDGLRNDIKEYNDLQRQERRADRDHNEHLHRESAAARETGFKMLTESLAAVAERASIANAATRELQLSHERDEARQRLRVMIWAFLSVFAMCGTLTLVILNLLSKT